MIEQSDFFQHLVNGLSLGSIYALIALGYTMVYGVLQMINFAHSDIYMMGAFAAYYVSRWIGLEAEPGIYSLLMALFTSMLACAALGVLTERLAYRPLRRAPKLNVLITAIGVSLFLQFGAQILFGADPKVFPQLIVDKSLIETPFLVLKTLDLTVFLVTLLALIILHYLVFHTKMGKSMRAISHSMTTASLLGINVNRVVVFTFILGSCLAGIGSVLVGLKYPKIEPLMGVMIGLKAFVAAVLGGIGNMGGAVLGAMIMGLSEEFVVAYLSSTMRDALAFGLLIGILIWKPSGLLGKNSIEKV
jgi:branched-chain amino acid transport system permease protein